MAEKLNYTNEQIKAFIDGIYYGTITEYALPESLYFAIANYLKSGLYEGFGGSLVDFSGRDLELLTELRTNIYMFSAAKTYQQTLDQKTLLFNDDGTLRTKRDFTQNALRNYDKWNEQWGLTERNTAVGQAQMAVKWDEIERNKDILPYLRYVTVGDDLVSDICSPLNGIVAKVDDPIWSSVSPLNHFNCRCLLLQEDKYSANLSPINEKKEAYEATLSKMQNEFKMNSGKNGYIFSPEHPYFDVRAKDRGYAKNNFNLPIPDKD